ncbi:Gfo/Idh/MocA family protein [Clostridium sp. DL1XJH146]
MTMKEMNFAIVGFGGIAKTHAMATYDAAIRFNLPYKLKLTHIITRRPIDQGISGVENSMDLEQVLSNPDIDFIDICTPNESHLEILKQAAKYKKPVYCEKPLASIYEEALSMTRIVDENNLITRVALMYRYSPAVNLLKREIEEGTIGDIIDFKIKTYHSSYLNPNKKGAWRTKKESGGGALLDLGVHLIDCVQYTLGDINKIKANTRIYFKDRTEVDEIAKLDIILKNGANGSLEVSRVFAEREHTDSFVVYGTKGSISVEFSNAYDINIFLYEKNITMIKSVGKGDELLKYYPERRNSLGYFQSCHTASLIGMANKVFGIDDNIGAGFDDALSCQKLIKEAYFND